MLSRGVENYFFKNLFQAIIIKVQYNFEKGTETNRSLNKGERLKLYLLE